MIRAMIRVWKFANLVAARPCERYHGGRTTCVNSGHVVDARYGIDQACKPCSARLLLDPPKEPS